MTRRSVSVVPSPVPAAWPIYRVVRFYKSGRGPRTIKQGLTRAEAQEHCSRDDTHGPDWFDGFDLMHGYREEALSNAQDNR